MTSPASDVFSLGATLVFAATGHPPYRGDTVMDVLVRLATEPPDLDGVPRELAGLIAACLQRVPRDRPTDAAILSELGSFAAQAPGPGHSYLPDSAMALIAEYLHGPPRSDGTGTDEDSGAEAGGDTDGSVALIANDATAGSHTALPGFAPAALRDWRTPSPRRERWRRGRRPGRGDRSGPRGQRLAWAGLASVAVLLVGGGIGTGLLLRGSPAATATTPCYLAPSVNSAPQICVSQPFGDGYTEYVIHGSGFVPKDPVTVTVNGTASPDHPTADKAGTFNYAIDQGHYFFHGRPIPAGGYQVVVTAPGGLSADLSFQVYSFNSQPPLQQGQPGPPPSGPPPGGQP